MNDKLPDVEFASQQSAEAGGKSTDAARMMVLFAGNEQRYGTHREPYQNENKTKWLIKKSASTERGPTTVAMWADHLSGKTPLGIIPIRKDNTCVWGSIDDDRYDIDLVEIIQRVYASGLPL